MFIFNTLVIMFSSLLFRIVGMIFGVYVSNKIGEEALGVFQLVMSVYIFGITLATSGLNLASTRIVSEELANRK